MKKVILFIVAFMISAIAFTQSVTLSPEDLTKLDPTAKAQIQAIQTANQITGTIESASKWVGFGKEVGTIFKEFTATAGEFSKTKLGQFTMFLIAYKVLGNDLLGIIFGVLLMIVMSIFCGVIDYKYGRDKRVIYKKLWNESKKKYEYEYTKESGDEDYRLTSIVIFIVSMIVSLIIIFV